MEILLPQGWPRPKGYSNGIAVTGRTIYVSGQVGWDAHECFVSDDFVDQLRQTLSNIVAVLNEGGAGPEHIVRMTWYITDKTDYLANRARVGEVYRQVIGPNYPVMSLVEVKSLLEDRAKVEIEATAVVP